MKEEYLAQGCATYSKRKNNYAYNTPKTINTGGAYKVFDDKGVGWTDMSGGLGAQLIGFQNSYSLTHSLAEPVAKLLCQRFRFESAKILQSGSAACDAAVRIARAARTDGRTLVYSTGYHGSGSFISAEKPGLGTVPEQIIKFDSDEDLIDAIKASKDVAAVIIEPVKLDWSPEREEQLRTIRSLCDKKQICLIYDEIITGMRVLKASVANAFNIRPDLMTVGKAIGNGFPFSAVLGPRKVMELNYFVSNTHNANQVSLTEAHRVLKSIGNDDLRALWARGERLMRSINEILEPTSSRLVGYPTRGEYRSDDMAQHTAICELMATRRYIVGRAHFFNFLHTPDAMDKLLIDLEWSVGKVMGGYKAKGPIINYSFKRN